MPVHQVVGVGGEGSDRAAEIARRLGSGESSARVPAALVGLVAGEHELGPHPARRDRERGDAMRAHFLGNGEGEAIHRRLGEVVEEVAL